MTDRNEAFRMAFDTYFCHLRDEGNIEGIEEALNYVFDSGVAWREVVEEMKKEMKND